MLRGGATAWLGLKRPQGLVVTSLRCKNKWTDDPKERFRAKSKPLSVGMGNRPLVEQAGDFPVRPIEHSASPYLIEHPKGVPSSFLDANKLKDNPGAHLRRKIVGRGPGSGLGKTAGKGTKGQRSRSGKPLLLTQRRSLSHLCLQAVARGLALRVAL
jgi:hypothetical protein